MLCFCLFKEATGFINSQCSRRGLDTLGQMVWGKLGSVVTLHIVTKADRDQGMAVVL